MGSLASSVPPTSAALDSRLIATTRLVLSSSVLFIIGPADFDQSPNPFHILAFLYTAYSALLYLLAAHPLQLLLSKISYWADLSWAVLLVAWSDEASVALLFLFPTLMASLQWSFVAALRLTLVAANLLVAIGLFKAQLGADLRLHEIVLPPIYLLVFGYLLAWWGDREITAKRRLVLLKEISRLSNPRFGIDRTIGTMMERLRAFYDADACLMITSELASNQHLLRRAERQEPERAIEAEPLPPQTAQLLLAPPLERALLYFGARQAWQCWGSPKESCYVFEVSKGRRSAEAPALAEALITLLDAQSFVSVPLHYPESTIGRLYLTAARQQAFSFADVSFLLQAIEQIVPVIENIRLVDQLATNAAEEERQRLARDIHDNVIQSYIGFQIALAAVSQKLHTGSGEIAQDIAQLMALADQEIGALRQYVRRLPGESKREDVLLAAVQRFVATFSEATHIAVQVEAAADLQLNDRLVAEVFQMVVEGLSNIRRHTHASCATIRFGRENDSLMLQIVNDRAEAAGSAGFIPWSIAERAAALGGQARVEQLAGGNTQVAVEIPL